MSKLFTLVEVVGKAQIEIGIAQSLPSLVVGSLDQDVVQMSALMAAVADEVLLEEPYRTTLGDGIWSSGVDGKPRPNGPVADTDYILFDGRLAVDGLKMKFLQAKGLEYGEQLRDFNTRLSKLAQADARILDLDADPGRVI